MEGEKQMTEQLSAYRKAIDTARRINDPYVMVRREDMAALLDCWQHQQDKPRVRVKARLTEPELAE